MIDSLSSRHNRHVTVTLLVLSCLCAVGSAAANPVAGDVLALILGLFGSAAIVSAFTHAWHSVRKFRLMAALVIAAFGILGIAFEVLAPGGQVGTSGSARTVAAIVVFLIAVLVCPVALAVALLGIGAISLHARRSRLCRFHSAIIGWDANGERGLRRLEIGQVRDSRFGANGHPHHEVMLNGHGLIVRRRRAHRGHGPWRRRLR